MTNLAEPTSSAASGATAASGAADAGFVDFYEMLGAARTASTIQLRSRINEMYGEAQANRDHRNLDKRSQYAALLHWLPVCRAVLLHEGKRAKYNAYAEQAEAGQPTAPFKPFLDELAELPDGTSPPTSAPLSIRSQPASSPISSTPIGRAPSSIATAAPDGPAQTSALQAQATAAPEAQAAPAVTPAAPVAPAAPDVAATPAPRGWVTLANPALRRELMGLLATAGGGFVALFALFIARGALHLALTPTIAACVLAGAFAWLVLRAALVRAAPTQL